MNKAENYLYNRMNLLSEEKQEIYSKINNIQIEINEIESKVQEMSNSLDIAFEIFSPRTRKNDFFRTEIESLVEQKNILENDLENLQNQYQILDEDISIIKDALEINETEDDLEEDSDNYLEDDLLDEDSDDESDGKMDGKADTKFEGLVSADGDNVFKSDANFIGDDKNINDSRLARQINDGALILDQYEREKQRIARDLHDSSVQVLTNLVHKCEICSKVINVDSTRAKLELEVMAKTLRDVIDELRDLVYNLRPVSFEDVDFKEYIENELRKLKQFSDIYMSVNVVGEYQKVASIILLTIMRVVVEATNNAIKHSKCNNIEIDITMNDELISLNIKDDGIGFDISNISKPSENNKSCFGLEMMKERIAMLNGDIDIISEDGKGTMIKCSVPYKI